MRHSWMIATLLGGLLLLACDKSSPPPAAPLGAAPPSTPAGPVTPAGPATPTAVSPTKPAAGPRWVCEQPTLDFGTVWEGVTVERRFIFRNDGDSRLTIEEPKPHCSCSTTPDWTKEVPPGGTGVIPFVLKTANKPHGPLKEYLTIETNDPANRSLQIWLTGNIKAVCTEHVVYDAIQEQKKAAGVKTTNPTKASFGTIQATDRLHRVIRLRNPNEQPLTLQLQPAPPNPQFRVEFKEITPGQEFELTIFGEPPFPLGSSSMPIQFKTNIPEHPWYTLTAWARVPPRVEIIPKVIIYGQKKASTKARTIRITHNGETPIKVLAISTSEPRYIIRLRPFDPASPGETVIDVTIPGDGYEVPPQGELIEIRTNDPEFGVIQIPVNSAESPPMARPSDTSPRMYPVQLTP